MQHCLSTCPSPGQRCHPLLLLRLPSVTAKSRSGGQPSASPLPGPHASCLKGAGPSERAPPNRGRSAGWPAARPRRCLSRRSARTGWAAPAGRRSGRLSARPPRRTAQKTGWPAAAQPSAVSAQPSAAQQLAKQRADWWQAQNMLPHPLQVLWKRQRRLRKASQLYVKCRRCRRASAGGTRVCSSALYITTQVCGWHEWGPDARPSSPALSTRDRQAAKGASHAPMRTARTCAAAQARSQAAAPRARPPPGWSPGRPRGCPRAPQPRAAAARPTAETGGSRMRACSPTPPRAARWPAGSCRSTRQPRTVPPPSPGYCLIFLPSVHSSEHTAGRARYQALAQGPYHPWTNATSTAYSALHQKHGPALPGSHGRVRRRRLGASCCGRARPGSSRAAGLALPQVARVRSRGLANCSRVLA
jgi:hypothetical protein